MGIHANDPAANGALAADAARPEETLQQVSGGALFALQTAILDELQSAASDSEKLKTVLTILRDAFEFDATLFIAEGGKDDEHIFRSTENELRAGHLEFVTRQVADLSLSGQLDLDADAGLPVGYVQAWYQFAHGSQENRLQGGVFIGLLKERREPSRLQDVALKAIAPIFRLMTGAIQTSRQLSMATQRFSSLTASLPGVVYQRRVTPDGDIRYTYISESAKELFGVSAEEILSNPKALFSTYAREYGENFRERLLQASKDLTKWDVEASIMMPDGTQKYTHAIATPDRQEDGSVLWTGVILDATRIKEAEKQVAAAEGRTRRAIVESLSQGFLMFDADDKLSLSNSQFKTFFPSVADAARIGADYTDLIAAEFTCTTFENATARRREALISERLEAHKLKKPYKIEHQIGEETWLQVDEHRTNNGGTVIVYTDVSGIKKREARIQHMALHDALTGLPNRTLFRDRTQQAIYEANRYGTTSAILCLDLDNFKNVNDTLGHPAGDELLGIVALRLKDIMRETDTVARLGGDEFAIVMHDVDELHSVEIIAERIIKSISEPFEIQANQVVIGTSIGISICDPQSIGPDDLIKNADLALYRSKYDGKNTFRFFEKAMDELAQARRLLETDLRQALNESHLELHFQPQINVKSRSICGFEALVRWHHPQRGTVSPTEFISLAEETGLIRQLGDWVLLNACQCAVEWSKPAKIAVNLSPAQFKRSGLIEYVAEVLKKTGLDPARLELEITETLLLHNTQEMLDMLFRLKGLGVRIAMDDFGTGFSSLGNLRSFPFDKIKIDRSFVSDIGRNPEAAAIVRAVVGLGKSLGIETTAEGVETREQLAYLMMEGCSEIQGYYYSHARPAGQVDKLLNGELDDFDSLGLNELSKYSETA
jgi:diguanylate cyclase (GGDEF)-like protein/PAS domain S-box-containing protein